ncbi:MAG: acetyl-CoA carboxylase biotin carboxyl carrier protein subunit [Candidatus Kryptoniota bacterium]
MPGFLREGEVIRFQLTDDGILLDSSQLKYTLLSSSENRILVKIDNKVREIFYDADGESINVIDSGVLHRIPLLTDREILLREFMKSSASTHHHSEIRAPMPGLVVKVAVTTSQKVGRGETLVILEAMKMENEIRSPREAEIEGVFVSAGDIVEKNQLLVSLK